jgi:hypothetical protein
MREMEHQTIRDTNGAPDHPRDTTVGQPKPIGARGATIADTVGAAQN